MDKQELIAELQNTIGSYLKARGLYLVDLICRHEGADLVLRVLADRPEGGITLGECARLNIQISNLLDEKDVLHARYILEVASPGLDRPLRERSDFQRCINRRARFFLNESVNGKIELEGVISKVEGDAVYIDCNDEVIEIPLVKINKAKQVIL